MFTDSSIRYQVSIKGRVEEGQEEQLHSRSTFTYGSVSGTMRRRKQEDSDTRQSTQEFAAEDILGVRSVFRVRLEWNATSCRVQQQRSEKSPQRAEQEPQK